MSIVRDLLSGFQYRSSVVDEYPREEAVDPAVREFCIPDGISFVSYYGLKENPFTDAIDLKYYFPTEAQRKACRRMYATVEDGISLGLLTGPSGSGKTIVTQILLENLSPDLYKTILVLVTPKMSKTTLLEEMVRELGIDKPPDRSREMLSILHRSVIDLHRQGRRLVIMIDEAHFLSSEALHMLRTVSNLEVPGRKLVTCILFAEEAFLRRLKQPGYRSLANRIYHRVRLGPMSAEETEQYIKYRLMAAGRADPLMDEEVYRVVAAASGGIHREVSRLCYLALLEGCTKKRPVITADLMANETG